MHSLHTPIWIFCSYLVISTFAKEKTVWPTAEQEAIDEIRDAQIVRAVQDSMKEWASTHHKHMRKKRAAVKKVCYNEVGCFEDSGPFSYLEMLPDSPEAINTKFYFYSTKNRSERPLMELPFLNMSAAFGKTTTEMPSSTEITNNGPDTTTTTTQSSSNRLGFTMDDLHNLDDLSVRVIVHGFGSACPHVWIYEMKTALMAVENCIVICVDWEKGAILPNYVKAAANTRLVGKQLAMLIQNLKEFKGLNLEKTHIIGFSLGAHVSGFAGAELPGLSRITGLDPAGPLFESQHPKARLDSSDAAFVDVIHSNGENLILGGLGSWQAMGHVDFYPNGGRVQTGCSNLFVGAVTDFIWSQPSEDEGRSLCNHRRAYKFFIDSVAPRCLFPAFPCESYDSFLKGKCFPCAKNDEDSSDDTASRCGNMGYYANRSTGRGQLYLVTREEEPFCAHQFQLKIFNSFNDLPLRTIGRLEATLHGEGGLNETFLISEKDDTEFFAGDIVSKIIVPHPALGFPTNLTLQYKSYSGWLAKGLPHWDIDKVILTDSFGRNHSLCRPSLSLTSGSMVHLSLLPGDCQLPDQDDYDILPTESDVTDKLNPVTENIDRLDEDGVVEKVKFRKDIFNLGTNFKLDRNKTFELKDSNDIPWHPILESNSLDRDAGESSRSLQSETAEIFEPVLKDRRLSMNKGRNLHDFDERTEEIVEPVLRSTTPKLRKVKQIVKDEEPIVNIESKPKPKEKDSVTIQLFPFRLGEFLERAERYAKETLLPLISEQAPRFFGFGSTEKKDERKPRYIPRYEEQSIKNNRTSQVRPSNKKITRKNDDSRDLTMSESQGYKNIFDLIRGTGSARAGGRRSITDVIYYTNDLTESRSLKAEDVPSSEVHIDLPTYRPPPSDLTANVPKTSLENVKKSISVSLV